MTGLLLTTYEFVKSLMAFVGIYATAFKFWPRRVNFSLGSFWICNYKHEPQSITNTVSLKFFNGGQLPQPVREEILQIVQPRIWGLNSGMKAGAIGGFESFYWHLTHGKVLQSIPILLSSLGQVCVDILVSIWEFLSSSSMRKKKTDFSSESANITRGLNTAEWHFHHRNYQPIPEVLRSALVSYISCYVNISNRNKKERHAYIHSAMNHHGVDDRQIESFMQEENILQVLLALEQIDCELKGVTITSQSEEELRKLLDFFRFIKLKNAIVSIIFRNKEILITDKFELRNFVRKAVNAIRNKVNSTELLDDELKNRIEDFKKVEDYYKKQKLDQLFMIE